MSRAERPPGPAGPGNPGSPAAGSDRPQPRPQPQPQPRPGPAEAGGLAAAAADAINAGIALLPGWPRRSAAALATALARSPGLAHRGRALAGELVRVGAGRSELPPGTDRRFADPAWSANPAYRRLAQAYVAVERAVTDAVEQSAVDWQTRERARFAAGVLTSVLAPTNTLPGNPAAVRHAVHTRGRSLLRGARNLAGDVVGNRGMPRQVDTRGFRLGHNLAATAGQVVFRNDVVEIIRYAPATPVVHEVPLLLVWSLINRYYIVDLAPGRSFAEYAVRRGVPVFVTSWRNPTAAQAHWDLDTYARALLDAIDAVRDISGSRQVGTFGFCAGGQLLAATLAHLAAAGDDRVRYACFAVSQLDMSVPNAAGIALHPALTRAAAAGTLATGVVDGRDIAVIFSWLRPDDLVCGYWVNNYLMGQDPPALDILAWNADTTRVAGAVHRDLVEIAQHNLLPRPGGLRLLGTPIDLSTVTVDSYVIGAETDHLVPWQGAYRSTQLLGGRPQFVLSGGGHVQHLVNPPGNPKARYRTGPPPGPDPDAWLAGATAHPGTWWEHWADWVGERSGRQRPARPGAGNRGQGCLEPAPGRYVRER
jgi:polyhydroxyalkanoate synthase subunit PhaC